MLGRPGPVLQAASVRNAKFAGRECRNVDFVGHVTVLKTEILQTASDRNRNFAGVFRTVRQVEDARHRVFFFLT